MCNMLPYVKFMNNNINTFDCNNYSDNLTDSHGVPLNESEVAGAIKGNPHDVLIETKIVFKTLFQSDFDHIESSPLSDDSHYRNLETGSFTDKSGSELVPSISGPMRPVLRRAELFTK